MKKLVSVLLGVIALLGCVFALSACSGGTALRYNVKYIAESDIGEDAQNYFVFHKNGTGEYYYHYNYVSDYNSQYDAHYHYVIQFKFTFVDDEKETIYCAYDGFMALDGHIGDDVSTDWSRLVTVSKNVLVSTSGSSMGFYINENYLDKIPNFNK